MATCHCILKQFHLTREAFDWVIYCVCPTIMATCRQCILEQFHLITGEAFDQVIIQANLSLTFLDHMHVCPAMVTCHHILEQFHLTREAFDWVIVPTCQPLAASSNISTLPERHLTNRSLTCRVLEQFHLTSQRCLTRSFISHYSDLSPKTLDASLSTAEFYSKFLFRELLWPTRPHGSPWTLSCKVETMFLVGKPFEVFNPNSTISFPLRKTNSLNA
ncbi:hypothetical protein EV424DRAFT_1344464 [Suillus variegatus]|nr:hypothetical protein EV424DRAFT_1344464 [Suillus variegatus]